MKPPIQPHIAAITPYPPGKPIEELERELGISNSIKLASNENAWGPSPQALEAMREALPKLHRYPDGASHYLTEALAKHLAVAPEQIVLGNGSNEMIEFLVKAFVAPGDEVLSSHPSFLMYQKFTQMHGGKNVVLPLKDMRHDLEGILAAVTNRTRLILLDNPNNPCGTVLDRAAFEGFLARLPEDLIVVLDEAYVDFALPAERIDTLALMRNIAGRPALAALRTFSKAYGLAGLRVGFGVMPAELAAQLHRVRQPFNINSLAQVGALAALADEEHYRRTIEGTRSGRAWLMEQLRAQGCRPLPSATNFFLVEVGGDGTALYQAMLRQGVIVRAMKAYGFPHMLRLTVGTEAENRRLVATMEKCRGELGYQRTEDRGQRTDRAAMDIVTIDGPSGVGKSTLSRLLAARLGYTYLDTGAMYRTVALQCRRHNVRPDDDAGLRGLLEGLDLRLLPAGGAGDDTRVLLDGGEVSALIRTPEVSMLASAVSARPIVRQHLTDMQRQLGAAGRVVAEGRDTGTVVFPAARFKFYLDASPEERARRRIEQLRRKGAVVDEAEVLRQQLERDRNDSGRDIAPLCAAADALRIDTSRLATEQVLAVMLAHIRELGGQVPGDRKNVRRTLPPVACHL